MVTNRSYTLMSCIRDKSVISFKELVRGLSESDIKKVQRELFRLLKQGKIFEDARGRYSLYISDNPKPTKLFKNYLDICLSDIEIFCKISDLQSVIQKLPLDKRKYFTEMFLTKYKNVIKEPKISKQKRIRLCKVKSIKITQ